MTWPASPLTEASHGALLIAASGKGHFFLKDCHRNCEQSEPRQTQPQRAPRAGGYAKRTEEKTGFREGKGGRVAREAGAVPSERAA